ncbi:MAG: hypothetical protein BWY76_02452 [bacterium ADurb.Bin429]|nr:MAG: hypothetical protein BWY76_02452 [bacterium ADurb.Bin429]
MLQRRHLPQIHPAVSPGVFVVAVFVLIRFLPVLHIPHVRWTAYRAAVGVHAEPLRFLPRQFPPRQAAGHTFTVGDSFDAMRMCRIHLLSQPFGIFVPSRLPAEPGGARRGDHQPPVIRRPEILLHPVAVSRAHPQHLLRVCFRRGGAGLRDLPGANSDLPKIIGHVVGVVLPFHHLAVAHDLRQQIATIFHHAHIIRQRNSHLAVGWHLYRLCAKKTAVIQASNFGEAHVGFHRFRSEIVDSRGSDGVLIWGVENFIGLDGLNKQR